MKDFTKIVNEQMVEFFESGKPEEIIQKNVESMFTSVVNRVLGSYSKTSEELEKRIKEDMELGNIKMDLPSYHKIVENMVNAEMDREYMSIVKANVAKTVKKLFKPLEKREWKLSEIIDRFKKSIINDEGGITLIVEDDNEPAAYCEFIYIYFSEYADIAKYNCDYCLRLIRSGEDVKRDKPFKLSSGTIARTECKDIKVPVSGEFDRFIFQLLAEEVIIECDDNIIEKDYYNGEDYD